MTERKLRFVDVENYDVETHKKNVRLRMKRKRSETENRDGKETLLVENCLRVIDAHLNKKAQAGMRLTVFVYLSFSSEASTDKLIDALLARDVLVLAPRIENGEMYAVPIGNDFTLSAMGIREPIGQPYQNEPHIVILPMLAVDAKGNRLGYGGGYYDKYLKGKIHARRIAYGYDFQVLENVPHTKADERVDCIVTEKRIIACNPNQTEEK